LAAHGFACIRHLPHPHGAPPYRRAAECHVLETTLTS
jgi:hypothetical protein